MIINILCTSVIQKKAKATPSFVNVTTVFVQYTPERWKDSANLWIGYDKCSFLRQPFQQIFNIGLACLFMKQFLSYGEVQNLLLYHVRSRKLFTHVRILICNKYHWFDQYSSANALLTQFIGQWLLVLWSHCKDSKPLRNQWMLSRVMTYFERLQNLLKRI